MPNFGSVLRLAELVYFVMWDNILFPPLLAVSLRFHAPVSVSSCPSKQTIRCIGTQLIKCFVLLAARGLMRPWSPARHRYAVGLYSYEAGSSTFTSRGRICRGCAWGLGTRKGREISANPRPCRGKQFLCFGCGQWSRVAGAGRRAGDSRISSPAPGICFSRVGFLYVVWSVCLLRLQMWPCLVLKSEKISALYHFRLFVTNII